MTPLDFYKTLSSIEQDYWHKLAELFQLVNPQKPEKGIKALILRARKASEELGTDIEPELETIFLQAKERTYRRIELLSHCPMNTTPDIKTQS